MSNKSSQSKSNRTVSMSPFRAATWRGVIPLSDALFITSWRTLHTFERHFQVIMSTEAISFNSFKTLLTLWSNPGFVTLQQAPAIGDTWYLLRKQYPAKPRMTILSRKIQRGLLLANMICDSINPISQTQSLCQSVRIKFIKCLR